MTGPPAEKAFIDGRPTPAGVGFAKSRGVDPSSLRVVDIPKRGAVVAVTVTEGGERVVDLLRDGLAGVIERIPFKKAMVWGEGGLSFGRPLHRVTVVYGGEPVRGEAHGIPFGDTTLGHRLSPGPVTVRSVDGWLADLRTHHVEPDLDVRAARIRALLDAAAADLGADTIRDDALAEEVLHLVEWPVSVLGAFDADLLELPPRLLVTSMKVHQRYFPVHQGGRLTNRFVVIGNNPFGDPSVVAEGNARVLRARFYDARFFFAEDRQRRLEAFNDKLATMRWIRGLGTMADKQWRVAWLARELAPWIGGDPDVAARAGALCKADLTSQMVGEFPELQGHMGRLYAAAQGESDAVATAIEEHYLPRGADDAVASTPAGVALAIADRLDTLVGCFGVGMEPSGGGDPQGLRRAALGLVRMLVEHGLRADLAELFRKAAAHFHASATSAPERFEAWRKHQASAHAGEDLGELVGRLVAFTSARHKAACSGSGTPADWFDAAFATVADHGVYDVVRVQRQVEAIAAAARSATFGPVSEVFKRVLNITRGVDVPPPAPSRATVPAEIALLARTDAVADEVVAAAERLDFGAALDATLALRQPVEAFFDAVMVNADDPDVRALRLGILVKVADTFRRVADFSRITTR